MAKRIIKGFTNYFSDVAEDGETINYVATPIEILSYDNNKYAEVRLPSGEETEIKTGYIYADEALTRHFKEVDWFVLGGGKRQNFRPRLRERRHFVRVPRNGQPYKKEPEYQSKAKAVLHGLRLAKELNEDIEVWTELRTKYSWSSGVQFVVCTPYGHAIQYKMEGRRRRRGFLQGNYMRGHGKCFVGRHAPQ